MLTKKGGILSGNYNGILFFKFQVQSGMKNEFTG